MVDKNTVEEVREHFLKGNPVDVWNPFAGPYELGGWERRYPGDLVFFDGPEENYRLPP